LREVVELLVSEWLFFLSLFGVLLTSLLFNRVPKVTPDELKVVYTLFIFLLILRGLERYGVVSYVAVKFERGRLLGLKLLLATALLSLFVTNDVALITTVPITAALAVEGKALLVALEAIVANGASALSPVGNPQNLFIYYHYDLTLPEFLKTILPFGLALLPAFALSLKVRSLGKHEVKPVLGNRWWVVSLLFLFFLLVALKVLPFYLSVVPLLYALLFDRSLFRVDYFLLGTFLLFFAFTDNLSHHFRLSLDSGLEVFFSSVGLSQVMSNVPAALLVSEFTDRWQELLWGVSVGGFGTLVASLANLIAFRLYKEREDNAGRFLLLFHLLNGFFLLFGVLLFFLRERL
jgi:Na+/H+ antiporter NhaD/arsenite permease-like protein